MNSRMGVFKPRRLVLTGPESTGKSTLAVRLAAHFRVPLVPEFARAYIQDKLLRCGRNCALEDVPAIAWGQRAAEDKALAQSPEGLIICDTDLLTIRIWSECFFGRVPTEIEPLLEQLRSRLPQDLYLLTDIDVPWIADGIRDRPGDRAGQMALFQTRLAEMGSQAILIAGGWEERLERAIAAIGHWLADSA
ncbi:AAA family ATPase [Caldichromatium japonicum]|uniref:AAA family ATPase n=1 Tax=Caldichromatium japonicum TaxID=2699430 RepID=A0A6G7VD30_9GAMM|nr:AAA family ATPase [Caldichromatium japonicum]QIK37810.1 AAA family ATPase [Caldichromatium japonicum]